MGLDRTVGGGAQYISVRSAARVVHTVCVCPLYMLLAEARVHTSSTAPAPAVTLYNAVCPAAADGGAVYTTKAVALLTMT